MDRPIRLKRLLFRSSHRGTKESDLLLGPYAVQNLENMTEAEIDEFEAFLEESDSDIWDWVSGATQPPKYEALIARLQLVSSGNQQA